MNKIYISIFILLISSCFVHSVPQADIDLVKGFLSGSELKQYFNLTSCESDFEDFMLNILEIIDDSINNNSTGIFFNVGRVFISYSKLLVKCQETEDKINTFKSTAYRTYLDPENFLSQSMDNAFSFSIVKQMWGLSAKIKKREFYEVGVSYGKIFAHIIGISLINTVTIDNYNVNTNNTNLNEILMELPSIFELTQ